MNDYSHLRIAFNSPAWPPEKAHNGIATYLKHILPGLNNYGVTPAIFSSRVISNQNDGRISRLINLENHPLKINIYRKIINYYLHKYNNIGYIAYNYAEHIHFVVSKLKMQLDIFEIEESFGAYFKLQKLLRSRVVVRTHGPWFLVGHHQMRTECNDLAKRIKLEGDGLINNMAITSPSLFALNKLREFYNVDLKHAEVIPNPIIPITVERKWDFFETDNPSVVFIGRFDSVKGGDIAIDSFRLIGLRNKEINFYFAGNNTGLYKNNRFYKIEEYINTFIPEEYIKKRIHYLGKLDIDDVYKIRKDANVTMITSRYETFPYSLIEAMSQGCPIVTTSVGGITEIIEHRHNGLLSEPESPESIAANVLELISSAELQQKISKNAIEDSINKYHPNIIAERTLNYYRQQL